MEIYDCKFTIGGILSGDNEQITVSVRAII
jgi:hypothetical protein